MIGSRVLPRAFFVIAGVLVPWTVYLAVTLPRHYSAHHYWLGWVGFDLALIAVLLKTGLSLARGSSALSRYAAASATLLVVDAWFDILNAATTSDRLVALVTGVFFELPLAYLCWQLARRASGSLGSEIPVDQRGN